MMKSKSAEKIKLTSYDDLFGSSEVTAEEKIVSVPIRLFHTFKDHPFRVLDDEKNAGDCGKCKTIWNTDAGNCTSVW